MPASSSRMLQGFHDARRELFQKLNAPRHYLVKRVLKKHSFQPIADVPRWSFTRPYPRLVDIAFRTQNLEW
jgi:hypothetical protein